MISKTELRRLTGTPTGTPLSLKTTVAVGDLKAGDVVSAETAQALPGIRKMLKTGAIVSTGDAAPAAPAPAKKSKAKKKPRPLPTPEPVVDLPAPVEAEPPPTE